MELRRAGRPLTIGHKGAAALGPENTLRAIAAALDAGVDLVEVDVIALGDGTLVLAHSDDLAEVTHGAERGRLGERRLAELRRLAPELATLDEALCFLGEQAPGAGLHVDLKRPGYEQQVVSLLRRHGAVEHAIVSSPSSASLRALAALEPRILRALTFPYDRLGLARRRALRPAVSSGAALLRAALPLRLGSLLRGAQAEAACLHHSVVSAGAVRRCHALGAAVLAWTVNDEAALKRVLAAGVDAVITDDPRLLGDRLRP